MTHAYNAMLSSRDVVPQLAISPDTTVLAGLVSIAASLDPRADRVEFLASVETASPDLRGVDFVIEIGPVTIMAFKLSSDGWDGPQHYGPTYLSLAHLKSLTGYDVTVRRRSAAEKSPVSRLSGDVLDAITIADEETFFRKVQLNHSRYGSKALLHLGARSAFLRFSSFPVRASALTIIAHRLLELRLTALTEDDWATLDWVVQQSEPVVAEGSAHLRDAASPGWEIIRWTTSLATVAAHLCLCRDDLARARRLYAQAAAQLPLVARSRVSALNLVNASLMLGVLSFFSGDREGAKKALERGVTSYPSLAAAQNLLENVWVIGDLVDCARSARQCFIALARFGLLAPCTDPVVDESSILDLHAIKSPVAEILRANLAPTLSHALASYRPA